MLDDARTFGTQQMYSMYWQKKLGKNDDTKMCREDYIERTERKISWLGKRHYVSPCQSWGRFASSPQPFVGRYATGHLVGLKRRVLVQPCTTDAAPVLRPNHPNPRWPWLGIILSTPFTWKSLSWCSPDTCADHVVSCDHVTLQRQSLQTLVIQFLKPACSESKNTRPCK